MRCLALTQAWQDMGGNVAFSMSDPSKSIESRLRAENVCVEPVLGEAGGEEDALETVRLGRNKEAVWIVVDGYQFDSVYQRSIKDSGLKLLWIDDYGHAAPYCADIVLNQNVYAKEELYKNREFVTRLLLGADYTLLRREFRQWCRAKRVICEKAKRILVTLGGGDPDNVTLTVIEAIGLCDAKTLLVRVVVGATNPHLASLRDACEQSCQQIEVFDNVSDMVSLMAWADVAISAGGSTCWEMAFMGLPNAVVVLAENQRPIAEYLDKRGVSLDLGWHEFVTKEHLAKMLTRLINNKVQRVNMSKCGMDLVDGQGAARIVESLVSA